jgi:hypothetical protein
MLDVLSFHLRELELLLGDFCLNALELFSALLLGECFLLRWGREYPVATEERGDATLVATLWGHGTESGKRF